MHKGNVLFDYSKCLKFLYLMPDSELLQLQIEAKEINNIEILDYVNKELNKRTQNKEF